LDSNFATAITLGNTAVYLGNTTTSIGNLTLTNVTISSGEVTTGNVSVSGNVTLSGGTANGVAYLNTSKVLTTGSSLTWDGTNLTVNTGTVSATYGKLTVAGGISITPDSSSKFQIGRYSAGAPYSYIKMGSTSSGLKFTDPTDSFDLMTLDSSGNLGLGVTPSAWGGTGVKALDVAVSTSIAGSAGSADMYGNAYYNGSNFVFKANGYAFRYQQNIGVGFHAWSTSNNGTAGGTPSFTQAMTLDASGNLLVGTTSVGNGDALVTFRKNTSLAVRGTTTDAAGNIAFVRSDTNVSAFLIAGTGATWYFANADFSYYGYLNQTMTAWNFASDRRIKTDISDIEYGLDAVMAMKPRKYKMISSGETNIGFVAQELQTVIPEAVTGEEIEYFDTDTPQEKAEKTMGVSKETLIPVLVKAIQEQQALITQLTARITALESA
jgi:hypothetical protein